ncbi:MAG TPA: CBS domain-containing protein [Clostridiaceae bacterium]|jgi:stage IV sporulation protein FB|nr:CBS domain-containing protein [Clostridiaceae bacterium]
MYKTFWRVALTGIILACLSAILIHEGFHIIASRLFGVPLYAIRPTVVGIRAQLKGVHSLRKQIAVYMAGSFGNFLTAALLLNTKGFLLNICEANAAIGFFNLLPLYPLDGGQIFIIISYKLLGGNRTFQIAKRLSVIIKIYFFVAGILQLALFLNPSLLAAALFLPGGRHLEETISIMKLERLLNRKQRIMKKKIYPVKEFAAMGECSLLEVIQRLDYDCFHIIYILNEDMEIIGRITEQDVINAIQNCNYANKISDVFKDVM